MPVSTRSHLSNEDPSDNQTQLPSNNNAVRNPHHGLKEKLKSLTLLYEQHKLAHSKAGGTRDPVSISNAAIRNADVKGLLVVIDSNESTKPQEISNLIPKPSLNVVVARSSNTSVDPIDDGAKENAGGVINNRISGFSCPRKARPASTVARKLSLGFQTDDDIEIPRLSQEVEGAKSSLVLAREVESLEIESSKIMVFVRLRPMMRREKEGGAHSCVKIINRKDIYLTEFSAERDYLRLNRLRGRHFTFDASFPDTTTQQDVYSTTTSELVESVLQGRNGSVFCYGATGAGKTYTMLGTVDSPGVMVLAIKDLFTKIRQRSFDGNHVVHLSYLEVYNETVRDLLSPGRPLVLREDKQGIVASGLTQYRAYSTDEVMALLLQGNKNRTTEPTRANETSSRSHAILQVMVEYQTRDASSTNIVNRVGKLSLIDLAGSERALATDQRTARSLEGANINRSLLALSSCINALVEGKKHIPYRNSKLTQLLKNSLGGACNTVMIANISPSNAAFGETQNTLHWADRTKEIRNKIYETHMDILPESETDKTKLLLEVQKENRELRVQLARQQQKLLTVRTQSLAAAANSSPPHPPSSANPIEKRKTRSSSLIRARNCFTPDPTRKVKGGGEETVRVLQQTLKTLEVQMERMSREHKLQMKQKDEIIRELSKKVSDYKAEEEEEEGRRGRGVKDMVVTRASVRPKVRDDSTTIQMARQRFQSPGPTVKKRSFWDIATANSPSLTALHGRKTKSYVTAFEASAAAPSMLRQPGFAREGRSPMKQ